VAEQEGMEESAVAEQEGMDESAVEEKAAELGWPAAGSGEARLAIKCPHPHCLP
jgi:hypothetical protein